MQRCYLGKKSLMYMSVYQMTFVINRLPLHQHDLDETFYVTEGEFIFQLGDKKVKAFAGSTIFIPRMMPHAFLVTSEIGRTLFMLNPAGDVEALFAKYDSYQTIPPIEELMRVSAEFGYPVLGPQITED